MGRFYLNRALIAIGLAFAFLVMASIFVPGRLQADGQEDRAGDQPFTTVRPAVGDSGPLIGQLEGDRYILRIYGSSSRPLFTIYSTDGSVLASQIDADEAAFRFPDLKLPDARALQTMDAGVQVDW